MAHNTNTAKERQLRFSLAFRKWWENGAKKARERERRKSQRRVT